MCLQAREIMLQGDALLTGGSLAKREFVVVMSQTAWISVDARSVSQGQTSEVIWLPRKLRRG